MMELFRVAARLVLDKGDFDQGVQDADSAGRSLADKMTGYMEKAKKVVAGLFAVATVKKAAQSIWNLANETAKAGDRIDKNSQALGMSRKAYQEWDYILRQNGVSIDNMGMSMKTLQEAITGDSEEVAASLNKLGLSADHLKKLSPEEQFETMVKAMQRLPAGTEKSQIALQLFGRNAQSLMPLLNSTAGSINDLRDEARRLGIIMSDEDVDASVRFGDALDRLGAVWNALKQKFGAQFLPMLTNGLIKAGNALGRITTLVEKAFKTGNWKDVFSALSEEIGSAIPSLVDTIIDIVSGIFENADKIIDLAISIITGLADGLVQAMPRLIAKLPKILNSLFEAMKHLFASAGSLLELVFGKDENGGIKWPTPQEMWQKVKDALSKLWGFVQSAATSILKLVFGEDEDGGIKFPTTEEVIDKIKKGLNALWGFIKDAAKGILKLVFGEGEDGGIQFPTGQEIIDKLTKGLQALWNIFKETVTHILKLVFGEDENGGIQFPNGMQILEKLKKGLEGLWNVFKGVATNVLKLVFGEAKDGGIAFPTGEEILDKLKKGLEALWNAFKRAGEGILKLIFGEDENGGINFPTGEEILSKIKKGLEGLWNAVKGAATNILKLIFGEDENGGIQFPNGIQILEKLKKGLQSLWNAFKGMATNVLKLIFGESNDGGIDFPTGKEILDKLKKGLESLWKAFKSVGEGVLKLVFGESADGGIAWPTASELWAKIKEGFTKLWSGEDGNGGIKGFMKNSADWALGALGLPDVQETINQIREWWKKVTKEVFLTLAVNLTGGETSDSKNQLINSLYDFAMKNSPIGGLFGYAKGSNYIPNDGIAMLHRGETVLTASQARQYREGGDAGNMDVVAAIQGLRNDIQRIQLVVNGKTFGQVVEEHGGKRVNDYIGRAESRMASGYGWG